MNIPICPVCKEPTQRMQGVSSRTCAYYPPIYDEKGVNTNPDKNITTVEWICLKCGNKWTVKE